MSVELLSRAELWRYFPDSRIVTERIGPIVKSVIAVSCRTQCVVADLPVSFQMLARLYVDAEVELDPLAVHALSAALKGGAVLAAGPRPEISLDRASGLVRTYYGVWSSLPQVRVGVFGRGVVALSASGHERIRALHAVMSDDLAVSEAFAPSDQAVVGRCGRGEPRVLDAARSGAAAHPSRDRKHPTGSAR